MNRASVLGIAAILGVALLAAMLMAYQQRYYWELVALKASGADYVGLQISAFERPSIDRAIRVASLAAFPSNILGLLKLATLLAGVALIVTTQRQLAAMKELVESAGLAGRNRDPKTEAVA